MIVRPFDPEKDMGLLQASTFRRADVKEFEASGAKDICEAVFQNSIRPLSKTNVVLNDEYQLVSIGGLVHFTSDIGLPWMASTDLFDKHYLSLIKILKPILQGYLDSYDVLAGVVDVRNTIAMKFLAWLGFEFPDGVGFPQGGTYFQEFRQRGGKSNV